MIAHLPYCAHHTESLLSIYSILRHGVSVFISWNSTDIFSLIVVPSGYDGVGDDCVEHGKAPFCGFFAAVEIICSAGDAGWNRKQKSANSLPKGTNRHCESRDYDFPEENLETITDTIAFSMDSVNAKRLPSFFPFCVMILI